MYIIANYNLYNIYKRNVIITIVKCVHTLLNLLFFFFHIIYYFTGFGCIKHQQCMRETKITPFMKIVLYDFFMPRNNHSWGGEKMCCSFSTEKWRV